MTVIEKKIEPNQAQKECIENIKGKYLVIAGPGTGKTFSLIERIKNMLNKNISPNKILCLTFSDAAANEMRSRLSDVLKNQTKEIDIYTYHSFCNEIINENPEEFELPNDYKLISTAISRQFIKECIDELNPIEYRSSKNDPYVFLNTILAQIEEIKKNRLTKEEYFKNIKENPDWEPKIKTLQDELEDYKQKNKKIPQRITNGIDSQEKKIKKAYEIWKFYELYKSKMELNHYLDFNDMISFVLDKFENEPYFIDKISNKYEYILVDEYQDTNKNQNEIIFKLADANKAQNIFVVGDDDQIIYTFQGAKLDTIENFLRHYPDTKVICLKENMRSSQNILNCARQIVKQDSSRLEINPEFEKYNISKELISKNEEYKNDNPKIRCNIYYDQNQEYNDIVSEIDSLINSSDCPKDKKGNKKLSEIAILTKSNNELLIFAQLLKDRNIPFELKEGKNIFEIKSFIVLFYYMQMLINPELNSDKIFRLLLLEPFKINPLDYMKLYQKRSTNKAFINSMREIDDFIEKDKIENFIKTFDYLKEYQTNENLRNIIIEIGSKTGIFNHYLNSKINQIENIAAIKKILDEANDFISAYKDITLVGFVEYLQMLQDENIAIAVQKAPIELNAVQLSTYHSSKGKEYLYVYMPTLLRNLWEADNASFRASVPLDIKEYKTDEQLQQIKKADRIKLMYVGMTRAKKFLRLSYVQYVDGKIKKPSDFILNLIQNVDENFLEINQIPQHTIDSFWEETKNSIVKKDYDYKRDFDEFINLKLKDKFYSPSSINTYLNCPRQFLYEYIFELNTKYGNCDLANYGSIIHSCLEYIVKFAKNNNTYPNKNDVIDYFSNTINSFDFSSIEQKEILVQRGKNAIDEFYPHFIQTPIESIFEIEHKLIYEDENYKFKGFIDRIDKNPDGSYSIYDYKTGNAKGLNLICPNGKNENYYIQIGLYKYFFEKITKNKVNKTGFIFPEDFSGNLEINFTDEEIKNIIEKFKSTIKSIKNHEFEPNYKNANCEYCAYRDFCALNII